MAHCVTLQVGSEVPTNNVEYYTQKFVNNLED